MSAGNVLRQLMESELPDSGKALFYEGGTAAKRGFIIGWGASTSSEQVFAKGAIFFKVGGAAHQQLYLNEGSGYGSAPSWQAITT